MRMPALLRTLLVRTLTTISVVAVCATSLSAQTIDAGMTREQVVAKLGRPMGERTTGPRTYLFYRNGCEQRCGMHDLVVLENDGVVDAIFRKGGRRYSGESSSPVAVPPRTARRASGAREGTTPAGSSATPVKKASVSKARPARKDSASADRATLPPGTKRGGIVIGNDPSAAANGANDARSTSDVPARRNVTSVAGSSAGGGSTPAVGQPGAPPSRPRPQNGAGVRVPIVPRDAQLGVEPRERGKRTLPGPVTVPVTPRDTQVARPDGAPAAPAPQTTTHDSTTSNKPQR